MANKKILLVDDSNTILMDVVMPTMAGFAACRALRAREETRAIPVIMVTTRGEADKRVR